MMMMTPTRDFRHGGSDCFEALMDQDACGGAGGGVGAGAGGREVALERSAVVLMEVMRVLRLRGFLLQKT